MYINPAILKILLFVGIILALFKQYLINKGTRMAEELNIDLNQEPFPEEVVEKYPSFSTLLIILGSLSLIVSIYWRGYIGFLIYLLIINL